MGCVCHNSSINYEKADFSLLKQTLIAYKCDHSRKRSVQVEFSSFGLIIRDSSDASLSDRPAVDS